MGTVRKSFTFIELVVTIGIVAFIVQAIFGVSYVIFRQQIILNSMMEVKRQGDNIAQAVKTSLSTNARKIIGADLNNDVDICPVITTPTPTFFPKLYVEDSVGNNYSLGLETNPEPTPNRIASLGASLTYLTNQDVSISNFAFSCYKSTLGGASVVTTKYTVSKNGQSLDYRLKVRLNTY